MRLIQHAAGWTMAILQLWQLPGGCHGFYHRLGGPMKVAAPTSISITRPPPLHASITLPPDSSSSSSSNANKAAAVVGPLLFDASVLHPVSYGMHLRVKDKVLNIWSALYAITILSVASLVMPLMIVASLFADITGNGRRRKAVDWLVHYWARISLQLCGWSAPRLYGAEHLPPAHEAVVYVPNHTSYFDILVLSGFVPRPFKYLSKAEILDIPLVGMGMRLARHVFLKRNDLHSTIQCADTVQQRLRDGNAVVLFAEGTRSPDGSLKAFKKGAFQMAKAAGVKIVPVSIGNLHRLLPANCPLPIAPIRHAYVQIHAPIDTANKSVKEIRQACFDAVNSGLPKYQQAVTAISDEGDR